MIFITNWLHVGIGRQNRLIETSVMKNLSALWEYYRSRISLIKQLNKGWNTYKKLLLENGITPSNCCDELSCDGSLVCGNINFGDDELNWIKHLNVSKYFIKEVEGHMRWKSRKCFFFFFFVETRLVNYFYLT